MKFTFERIARELQNYLGRAARESSVDLQGSPEKTQLIDVQRRIRIYLHALWGCDFVIKSIGNDLENREIPQPFIKKSYIHLPDYNYDFILDGVTHFTGLEVYRAAATHAAAH